MDKQKPVPEWDAPESLLPRVLAAVQTATPDLPVRAERLKNTLIIIGLCTLTGILVFIFWHQIPALDPHMQSIVRHISSFSKIPNIVSVGLRTAGHFLSLSPLVWLTAGAYSCLLFVIGLAGFTGLTFLFKSELQFKENLP